MQLTFNKILTYFIVTTVVVVSLLFLLIAFDGTGEIAVRVDPLTQHTDTLQRFENAVLIGPGELVIREAGYFKTVLAPREHLDTLYTLFFFLAVIWVIVFYRDFSYQQLFTQRALTGLRVALGLLLALYLLDMARNIWFYTVVRSITGNRFSYEPDSWLTQLGFWFAIILMRLIWVFKKGIELQGETDLTI